MISKNKLKFLSSLKLKKKRDETGLFLIEGMRLCEEATASNYVVDMVLHTASFPNSPRAALLLQRFKEMAVPISLAEDRAFKQITDTVHPQGIVAVVRKKAWRFEDLFELPAATLVALDRINDPGNLGAILRTASWFGCSAVLLSKETVEYTNPKVVRASMGAVFHTPIFEDLDLPTISRKLQEQGYGLFLADESGETSYAEVEYSRRSVLILGNEAVGVGDAFRELSPRSICIPRFGKGESLNVAVAAGIVLAAMAAARRNFERN